VTNNPNIVGVSLATGKVVSNAPIGLAEDSFIGVGQNIAWEPDTGAVIASGENAAGDHLFGLVDPITGKLTPRAQLNCTEPKCLPVMAGPADYAPDSKIYLTQLGTSTEIDFLAVNMTSGGLYSTPDCDTLETLDFDKASWGICWHWSANVANSAAHARAHGGRCEVMHSRRRYPKLLHDRCWCIGVVSRLRESSTGFLHQGDTR